MIVLDCLLLNLMDLDLSFCSKKVSRKYRNVKYMIKLGIDNFITSRTKFKIGDMYCILGKYNQFQFFTEGSIFFDNQSQIKD